MPLSIWVAKSANCPENGRMTPILIVPCAEAACGEANSASAAAPLRIARLSMNVLLRQCGSIGFFVGRWRRRARLPLDFRWDWPVNIARNRWTSNYLTATALTRRQVSRSVEPCQHLRRDRPRAQPVLVAGIAHGPHPLLVALQRGHAGLGHAVQHGKAGAAELLDAGLDLDVVAVLRGHRELGARLDQREPGAAVFFQHLDLGEAGRLPEQQNRTGVEPLEIAWVEDDAGGVAVAPLDTDRSGVGQHSLSSHATGPSRLNSIDHDHIRARPPGM